MRTAVAVRSLFFSFVLLTLSHVAVGQIGVGISVRFGPPALPVYEQPICPADGLLWTPGYWAYDDDDGYYWVPGTWVEAPEPGFLWTPGYWGWGNGFYIWNAGYWGPHVGFYGGINYGFGYFGVGFGGGALYSPPACLVSTTPVLKSPALAVAAMGGLPWLAEARSWGLARACSTCWVCAATGARWFSWENCSSCGVGRA